MIDVAAIGDADSNADTVFLRWTTGIVDDLAIAENAVRYCNFDIILR